MEQYFAVENGNLVMRVSETTVGHTDTYEMSGYLCDALVTYGTKPDGETVLWRRAVFPTLLRQPLDTFSVTSVEYNRYENCPLIFVNGAPVREIGEVFTLDGTLAAVSRTAEGLRIVHRFCPAADATALCEQITVENRGESYVTVGTRAGTLDYLMGTKGVYKIGCTVSGAAMAIVDVDRDRRMWGLMPGECLSFDLTYGASVGRDPLPTLSFSDEYAARRARLDTWDRRARLVTGNEILDTFYRFAKYRAGESIFRLSCGLLHSPGGGQYYAASWCNDQLEYAAPWFAFTGDCDGIEASLNAYGQYAPFMTDRYGPIPSSVICEGSNYWNGAGDRGDAAMFLYGSTLCALYRDNIGTDSPVCDRLWDDMLWCAEYCRRKMLPDGTVSSDSDELEGRFPTDGVANLSTSCLCARGLIQLSVLCLRRGRPDDAARYRGLADTVLSGIETRFGATLHGYDTYRYSAGIDTLRSWICLPLCFGIGDSRRTGGTVRALLSDYLRTDCGFLTCETGGENPDKTVWDRSTLYAFRGLFARGLSSDPDIWRFFLDYCRIRLTGDRVPCPVEAYPEGNRRHLSAESALFCRIIPEGLLSLSVPEPDTFTFVPRLPDGCGHLILTDCRIGGRRIDFYVDRDGYRVTVDGRTYTGDVLDKSVSVTL